jgi:hypothetical protein
MITVKGFMEYRKSRQRDRILEILRKPGHTLPLTGFTGN